MTANTIRRQIEALAREVSEAIDEYNRDARALTAGVRNGSIRPAARLYIECDLDDDRDAIRAKEARIAELETALRSAAA